MTISRIFSMALLLGATFSGLALAQGPGSSLLHGKFDDLYDWRAYNNAGWRAIAKGNFVTAEHEFLSAIKVARRPGFDAEALLSRSYADLAEAIQRQGRAAEAEPLAKWALAARESRQKPGSSPVAQSLNQLASIHVDLGRLDLAEPLLRRASGFAEGTTRAERIERARSHGLLGLVLVADRRYAEAEPAFTRAVRLREAAQGAGHPETGDEINNLAWALLEQGKTAEARPWFDRALDVFERTRGPADLSVARALDGLARIEAMGSTPAEAEARFVRSIAIRDALAAGQDFPLAETRRHYADLLDKLDRPADAARVRALITKGGGPKAGPGRADPSRPTVPPTIPGPLRAGG